MKRAYAVAILFGSAMACARAPVSSEAAGPVRVAPTPPAQSASRNPSHLGQSTIGFGLALHQALTREREWSSRNIVISPASASAALSMVYGGAHGETAREIAAALHTDRQGFALHEGWARLRSDLGELEPRTSNRAPVEFVMANALWLQTGLGLLPTYRALIAGQYGGAAETADFAYAPDEARGSINRWVKERTRGLVPELFPSGSLAGSTPIVVVNTAYLRGAWAEPFPRSGTRRDAFEKLNGRRVEIPMMHHVLDAGYVETSDYQAAELRYVGDRLSLVLVLPARGKFLHMERSLNAAALTALIQSIPQERRRVGMALPKFAISTPVSLAATLTQLGMKRAFSAEAELDGMMSGGGPLFLGEVRHQVHLTIDEEQTEAAAATGVVVSYAARAPDATLRVDRPFLLGIYDRKTGLLLLWGRVIDPASAD